MLRPHQRQPQFDVAVAPDLASAWHDSLERFRHIGAAIGEGLPEFVACLAVSGSLARMEAHSGSDIDLIIVLDDRQRPITDAAAGDVVDAVWGRLDALGAVRPKPGGIFSVCARWKDLVDAEAKGRIDESVVTFGHRIQLLMDAQPVTSPTQFAEIQKDILRWYSETRLAAVFNESGPFHWLWQDVHRYWRSLRSRTCWLNANDARKSLALNVKLRSSRLILIFAFLKTLQQHQDLQRSLDESIDRIVMSLHRTPVERLFGHGAELRSWNTVWDFLRGTIDHPATELHDDVRGALSQIAETVEEMIQNSARSGLRQQWLM
ncbi:MAG: DUF294 nucleotidyltransferase-like domain-containing protein [Planctomycetaceae bacterium]|jgi:hypothetical protein